MIAVAEPVAPEKSVFSAFIGLDWADQKHDLVLYDPQSGKPESQQLPHTPEAIDEWACGLRQRFGGGFIAVCFEQSPTTAARRCPAIAYALLKYDFLILFPLPPTRLAAYRESFVSSGAKNDASDAALLLDYLLRHRDQLRVWQPDTPATRELQLLAEARREAVNQRTRLSNQLTAVLKRYFPQAITLVGCDVDTPLAADFLARWPSLAAVQRTPSTTLRKFYYAHRCRQEQRIVERLELVKSAIPLTDDPALIQAGILQVQCLVPQLRALHQAIDKYEHRLSELMDEHPDAPLFLALPGAGPALAPRLLVAFGTDRDRFQTAQELQTLSGVAPVTKRSGKRRIIHRRWACPKFLLQTFHEFAHCSRQKSAWAKAFYLYQRSRGKGHHAALRALAFKWIRILFRCWQTKTPYSEDRYLEALRRRNLPLLAFLPIPLPAAN